MNQDTAISNPLDDPRLASAVFFPRPDQPFGPAIREGRKHVRIHPRTYLEERLRLGTWDARGRR